MVGNSGPTVATDVHIKFTPPLPTTHDLTQAALSRLEKGYASLTPGRTVSWNLGSGPELLDASDPQPRAVSISGLGPFGPIPELRYVIDMTDFRESNDRPSGNLHFLTKAVNGLPSRVDLTRLTRAVEALGPADDEPLVAEEEDDAPRRRAQRPGTPQSQPGDRQ